MLINVTKKKNKHRCLKIPLRTFIATAKHNCAYKTVWWTNFGRLYPKNVLRRYISKISLFHGASNATPLLLHPVTFSPFCNLNPHFPHLILDNATHY